MPAWPTCPQTTLTGVLIKEFLGVTKYIKERSANTVIILKA